MSGSGRQCDRVDTINVKHVAQLRRLICLLMVWAFFLTLGIVVSILLHFILTRDPPDKEIEIVTSKPPPTVPSTLPYSFNFEFENGSQFRELRWKDEKHESNKRVELTEDGIYFFYLQVTLQSRDPSVNYTVLVEVFDTKENVYKEILLTGHINGSQLSTGFMGKAFHSPSKRSLKVVYKPKATLDGDNTYVGIIKLS
ncbi:tumor necrosis factor ligand superfamily member 18 [Astyanax mexicanus]|uniref:tumor necrosis factor ligand superfamily member 18 n=1 Tax=Astyanax mexicanus TaxID=7994 RepID=UPI0020CB0842|nr:tumor necrosis factor ligand superfamily member 18 [Astyanax mexicanus]